MVKRRSMSGLGLLGITAAFLCGCSGSRERADDQHLDQIMAVARIQAMDGAQKPLSSFRGKWLLVNIWATWCGPCRMEMPGLNRVWSTLHPAGLEMVGISSESPADVWTYLAHQSPGDAPAYPIATDPGGQLSQALDARSIPRTYIINPQGHVILSHEGYIEADAVVAALRDGGFPLPQG